MSTPMPACEALAADPARYIFKQLLSDLKEAVLYDEKHHMVTRIGGYLAALMECDVITVEQSRALRNETRTFVWGPDA
ncbi:hypothetical protein [Stutzerimonas nitrititolerans]|uniref:hypothetical protein n=1 Tax=Stutzerimonas nitrititolerans TaxID=2482751 RepID=UPI00289914C3|nr:hypothetical protein [Stutzerimonas nitrititolerans]